MGIMGYENTRANFDRILRLYKDYIKLYKDFSGGSLEGSTSFGEFYWNMSYYAKYADRRNFGVTGY